MVPVLPGVPLTLANPFRFNNLLINEDLPTLERPEKTISGIVESGSWSSLPAANSKQAFSRFILFIPRYCGIPGADAAGRLD